MLPEKDRYTPPSLQIKQTCSRLFGHLGYQLTLLDFCSSVSLVDEEGTFWISREKDVKREEDVEVLSMVTLD